MAHSAGLNITNAVQIVWLTVESPIIHIEQFVHIVGLC